MWKIDKDYINTEEEGTRVGHSEGHERIPVMAVVAGFESGPLPNQDEKGAELPLVRFRLLDDDREVMYGGELHDDDECLNQLAALRFGEGDVGATIIEVKRGGEWTVEIG